MRWKRTIAVVLGSVVFFPVSCTTGTYIGVRVVAALDKRIVLEGDEVHSLFKVVAEPGENGEPFRILGKREWASYTTANASGRAHQSISFRMSEDSGSAKTYSSSFSYQVLEDDGHEQLIELVEAYHDGDNTIWSRYKATRSTVSPVSSRMLYFGYMFIAMVYAFAGSFVILLIGSYFRRKLAPPKIPAEQT